MLQCSVQPRVLHSFPTRRSSDLKASIEFDAKESTLVLAADDDFKLNALWEIVSTKLVRRNVPVKNLTRGPDRKSTRLNSSHQIISYAVFCLKKKIHKLRHPRTHR